MDRNRRLYPVVRWGLLPALAQIGLLGLMIAGLVLLKPVAWTPRLNWVPDRMELGRAVNEPTLLRLIHMLLTIPLTAALLALGRRARTDRGAFWAGVLAGITAWQGVGECAWHFGVPVGPDFLFFPKLEGVQGTPVLILFLPVALRIVLDDRTKSVTVEGEQVALTPTEYAILHLLMANPGKVFSTKVLYESVWQEAALGSEGAVAVHIRHLREKIEINPSEPRYLKVVWGQGYKMEGGN